MAKKKSISIKSRKAKGRNLQKLVCKKLSELTGISWGKDKEIESREMGQAGRDIKLYGKAKQLILLDIECKNQEKWSVLTWIKQAKLNQEAGRYWALICKKNHVDPVIIMDLDNFLEIYKRLLKALDK